MSDLSGMSPAAASPPPAQSACGFCRRPIADQYFEFMGKVCCPPCADGVVKLGELHEPNTPAMVRGAIFGIGAAILCGVVWAMVARSTNTEWGILAVGVGWIVTRAIQLGSGKRRGMHMQAMAVCIAILGIVFGKLLSAFLIINQDLSVGASVEAVIRILRLEPTRIFRAFDLIWFFIAVLRPIQAFKPLNLRIRGPFSLSAGPIQVLQFDRVRSATPNAATPRTGSGA